MIAPSPEARPPPVGWSDMSARRPREHEARERLAIVERPPQVGPLQRPPIGSDHGLAPVLAHPEHIGAGEFYHPVPEALGRVPRVDHRVSKSRELVEQDTDVCTNRWCDHLSANFGFDSAVFAGNRREIGRPGAAGIWRGSSGNLVHRQQASVPRWLSSGGDRPVGIFRQTRRGGAAIGNGGRGRCGHGSAGWVARPVVDRPAVPALGLLRPRPLLFLWRQTYWPSLKSVNQDPNRETKRVGQGFPSRRREVARGRNAE